MAICPNCGKYSYGTCKCKPFECWDREYSDDSQTMWARTPEDAATAYAKWFDECDSELAANEREVVVLVDEEEKTFRVLSEYVREYWVV